MKKVWKYILIAFLLLIALCLVGVLYLFFVPGSSIFNITYISYNVVVTTQGNYKNENVDEVILNSNNYDVLVRQTEADKFYATVYCNALGFTLVKNSVPNINATYVAGTKRLQIDVTEPVGFVAPQSSIVTLYIPKNSSAKATLKNNSANTTINCPNSTFNVLDYKTNSGDLKLIAGEFNNDLKLNLGGATCTIANEVDTSTNNIFLNLKNGKFNAPSKNFNHVTVESNVRGVIIMKSCNKLIQTSSETAGGRIEIVDLYDADYTSGDTNLTITNLHGGNISLKKSGSVTVDKCLGTSNISTSTGSITINNAESNVLVNSDSGNITINNAVGLVQTKTEGKTTVNFKQDSANTTTLDAKTKNGSIIATNVDKINAVVDDGGKGNVDVSMRNIQSGCSIRTRKGNVNILFKDNSAFTLTAKQENGGSFWLNFANQEEAITDISKFGNGKAINGDTNNIKFTVTTTQGGSIRITDETSKNYT